jgi:BirA family biotin operon repressor/biotin-[acetyl-CoA-carboxylase] ligase
VNQTRKRVLTSLTGGSVSGPALADELGISRAAVWKHIEALREEGFVIESDDRGYHLTEFPEMSATSIEYGLDAPFDIEYHREIASTNHRAREIAEDGIADTVVVASAQTAGRGRLDRDWESPPGGVYLSIICRPDLPPAEAPLYTLAAAVATTRAIRAAGIDARIKWPNDVLVVDEDGETHKLAGILTEMRGEADRIAWLVVGIGVNADDPGIEGATGLRVETSDTVDRRAFVQRLLCAFDDLRTTPETILSAWRDNALTLGQRVRVETPAGEVVGEALDIEAPGTLIIASDDSTVRVHAGDCEHLRST